MAIKKKATATLEGVVKSIEDLTRVVATKKDLDNFATKKDLAGSIENLAQMIERTVAKKEDIQEIKATMATKKDLDIVEMRLGERLDGVDLDIIAHDQRLKKLETKPAHL